MSENAASEHPTAEDFPIGSRVRRAVGPMVTGVIAAPTRADLDRAFHIHGDIIHQVRSDGVPYLALVQWGYGRSWEYCIDLCHLPGIAGDL